VPLFTRPYVTSLSEEVAALVGVIWQAKDHLAFDFAVRQASVNSAPETEIRAGVTFAFSFGEQ
jgi:hypothetical protein